MTWKCEYCCWQLEITRKAFLDSRYFRDLIGVSPFYAVPGFYRIKQLAATTGVGAGLLETQQPVPARVAQAKYANLHYLQLVTGIR